MDTADACIPVAPPALCSNAPLALAIHRLR